GEARTIGVGDGAEDGEHLVHVPEALPGVRLGQMEEHELVEPREIPGDLAARRVVQGGVQLADDAGGAAEGLAEAEDVARGQRLARQAEKLEAALEDEEKEPLAVDDRDLGGGVALGVLLGVHFFPLRALRAPKKRGTAAGSASRSPASPSR